MSLTFELSRYSAHYLRCSILASRTSSVFHGSSIRYAQIGMGSRRILRSVL